MCGGTYQSLASHNIEESSSIIASHEPEEINATERAMTDKESIHDKRAIEQRNPDRVCEPTM